MREGGRRVQKRGEGKVGSGGGKIKRGENEEGGEEEGLRKEEE